MTLPLKTAGRKPISKPWDGDALGRKPYADALTNLLEGQTEPLVISINGSWGTGKTFFLRHWLTQLEQSGFNAIYFNAWEDDYCGDPLVAIIGQLWDALKESDYKEIAQSVKKSAKPLFVKTVFNVLRTTTAGVVDLDDDVLKSIAETASDDYTAQRLYRDELRKRLTKMAGDVAKSTKHPMVFIIDELDRCRPTFAIELLERVKHIFDIPNMVFVLGIDRDQLGNSIRAVYGDIDVDGYLRRFIDMEFVLPQGSLKPFVEHLLKQHGLDCHFNDLSERAKHPIHQQEFNRFMDFFASLSHYLHLRLRDIEYATRSFILVAKNLKARHYLYPELLVILIILRLRTPDLYHKFVSGYSSPGEVLDFIESFIIGQNFLDQYETKSFIRNLETTVYMAVNQDRHTDPIHNQMEQFLKDRSIPTPGLSKRVRELCNEDLKDLFNFYALIIRDNSFDHRFGTWETVKRLSAEIDLTSAMLEAGGRR